MTNYKYYACTPISRKEPTTVFKFHLKKEKPPERYMASLGWVVDHELFSLLANGELTEDEVISEEDALAIINRIDREN